METFKLVGRISYNEWLAKYTTKYGSIFYIVHNNVKSLSSVDSTPTACLLRESEIVQDNSTNNVNALIEPIIPLISELEIENLDSL